MYLVPLSDHGRQRLEIVKGHLERAGMKWEELSTDDITFKIQKQSKGKIIHFWYNLLRIFYLINLKVMIKGIRYPGYPSWKKTILCFMRPNILKIIHFRTLYLNIM